MSSEHDIAGHDTGPYKFVIRGTDTDFQDRLHLFSLFSFMQESAYSNAEAGGLGSSLLDRHGLCWMLIRISVRMDSLPRWGETLTVSTWSRGCRKLTWLRDYEFFNDDGERLGCATSEWLIASAADHRPQRPELVLNGRHLRDNERAVFPDVIPRPPRLDDSVAIQPVLTQYADFSDIDRNGHVNNTRYVAWCLNAVHAFARGENTAGSLPDGIEVRGLDIHYISEVRLGDKIHCYCEPLPIAQPAGVREYLVEARRAEDGIAVFRARILNNCEL